VEALGGLGRASVRTRVGGLAPAGDFLPGRRKTAVSASAAPALHECKSRRALPPTVTAVVYFVLPLVMPLRNPGCFISLPLTHWNTYLWYCGLSTFLQY
jgi:hypothetical protein